MKDGGAVTQSFVRKEKSTEADIACEILREQAGPLHYRPLIEEVLRRLGFVQDTARIAAVLTQINLDTRFSFMGNGEWGLKTWDASHTAKRPAAVSAVSRVVPDEEDDLELDILDEDILEEEVLETEDGIYDETDENRRSEKW